MPKQPSPDLMPCPFCGQVPPEDSHYVNQGTKWGGILCCIEGPEVRTSYQKWPAFKDAAVEAWNTRAPVNADLAELLKSATNRLERCLTGAGTDPEFAAAGVEHYRAAIASATNQESKP